MTDGTARPAWLPWVWLATAAYLVVELSFNSRLLDVVGGGATIEEIDRIELWGRLISGFALALVFWPALITRARRRHPGRPRRLGSLAAWTLLAMASTYAGQEALLQWLVARSDDEQLRSSQHLVLLQAGLQKGVVDLAGLDMTPEQMATPDGKALLAMFPMLGTGLGALVDERFGAPQRDAVRRNLAVDAMGDPNEHLERYTALVRELSSSYEAYGEALSRIDAAGAEAWAEYRAKLARRGWRPGRVPSRYRSRVRSELRASGVPVASDWATGDRAGFLEAATRHDRSRARDRFTEELAEKLPEFAGVVPPDALVAFLGDDEIQPRLLKTLGYSCMTSFDIDMPTAGDFKRKFYDREVACHAARGAAEEEDAAAGRTARRALLVPFIALSLSLFGALAHIAKFTLYSIALVRGYPLFRTPGLFAGMTLAFPLAAILFCAVVLTSPATGNGLYDRLDDRLPWPLSIAVRGTVHGQMIGYPVFEAVRLKGLRGFEFGYTERTGVPAAPSDS